MYICKTEENEWFNRPPSSTVQKVDISIRHVGRKVNEERKQKSITNYRRCGI